MHLFLKEKGRTLGVRLNAQPPSMLEAKTSIRGHQGAAFNLLSLPLYMVGQIRRLVGEITGVA